MLRSAVAVSSRIVASGTRSLSTTSAALFEAKPSDAQLNEVFKGGDERKRRHAYSVNRVELVGGVAGTPKKMVAKNGRDFAIFNLITNSSFRDANGETVDQSERHTITAFGRMADVVERTVSSGSRVLVHGRLHYSGGMLKEDGTRTPRNTHIHADTVQPMMKGGQQQQQQEEE